MNKPFVHCLLLGMYGEYIDAHTPPRLASIIVQHKVRRRHACARAHSAYLSSCQSLLVVLGEEVLVDIRLPAFVRLLLRRGRTQGCCYSTVVTGVGG